MFMQCGQYGLGSNRVLCAALRLGAWCIFEQRTHQSFELTYGERELGIQWHRQDQCTLVSCFTLCRMPYLADWWFSEYVIVRTPPGPKVSAVHIAKVHIQFSIRTLAATCAGVSIALVPA